MYKKKIAPVISVLVLPPNPNPMNVRLVPSCETVTIMAPKESCPPPSKPLGSLPTSSHYRWLGHDLLWLMGHL